jgi:hypothetical protein
MQSLTINHHQGSITPHHSTIKKPSLEHQQNIKGQEAKEKGP